MARYIDADKADVRSIHSSYMGYSSWADVLEWLQSQPTADVAEVKHGRWLSVGFGEYWCSVCDANGEDVLDKRGNPNWKHCPNCGAKMDE